MAQRIRAIATAAAVALGATLVFAATALAANRPVTGPYLSGRFAVHELAYEFGQDPSWTHKDMVLSSQFDAAGIKQIYRARANGKHQVCLTCRTVTGPNGLPQERPDGRWILFESYGQQAVHLGGPGLGGYGGDLYAMSADGSHPYRLTTDSDPNDGAPYGQASGVPYDNFHAYWSPNGRQVVWTHTEANPLSAGGETWSILLADFRVRNGRPSLRNVRVVGKPYGAYETQPWSPDGKGFLFSAAGGYNSPFQAVPPGWGNMRVYYMRLYGKGASPAHPRVTRIGDNAPFYEEQSIFTPDMRTVIMMSNRAATSGSWYGLVAAAAQRTGFDAPNTGSTQTLQFLADFNGPDFRSDLFAVDVRTKATRRLTFQNNVVPEFYWDRDYKKILWSLNGQNTATYTGRFKGARHARRMVPKRTPRALYGAPVDFSRVGEQAQPIRDPGPTDNISVAVRPPDDPAPAFPHGTARGDTTTVPLPVATYFPVWAADLAKLGQLAGVSFTTDPLKRLGL